MKEIEFIVTLEFRNFKPRNEHRKGAGPVNFVGQLTDTYVKPLCWDINPNHQRLPQSLPL